jgi:hypothetical protein
MSIVTKQQSTKGIPNMEGHTQKVSSVLTGITSASEIQAAIEGISGIPRAY